MTGGGLSTWVLVILLKGTVPPVGVVVEGFDSKEQCLIEALNYCPPTVVIGPHICKCELGSVVK